MKRIILLIFGLATIVANAQEKESGIMAEFSFGSMRYGNYPAVSAFSDSTSAYGMIPAMQLSVGYRFEDNWFLGVSAKYDGGNSSFRDLDEKFANLGVLIDVRHYFKLSKSLELEFGAAAGLLVHKNTFRYLDQEHTVLRLGFGGRLFTGINYEIRQNHYIGIKATLYHVGVLSDVREGIPVELNANTGSGIFGHSLLFSYGVKF